MEQTIRQGINLITEELRKHPIHFRELWQRTSEWKKRKPIPPGILLEELYFDPGSNINVFLHFIGYDEKRPFKERVAIEKQNQHRHNFFELCYLHSGCCRIFIGEKEYIMRPGSIFIFNVQQKHNVVLEDKQTNLYNIHVRQSTFSSVMMSLLDSTSLFYRFFTESIYSHDPKPNYLNFQMKQGSMLELHLFVILSEYLKREELFQSNMLHAFCCLLTELSRQYELQAAQNKLKERSLTIQDLLAYICKHYGTVSLKNISENFKYSPNYISQYILKQTGKSFSQTIQEIKLGNAKKMLLNPELPIEHIAEILNYSNRSAFEIAFKKAVGMTPRQFRRLKS